MLAAHISGGRNRTTTKSPALASKIPELRLTPSFHPRVRYRINISTSLRRSWASRPSLGTIYSYECILCNEKTAAPSHVTGAAASLWALPTSTSYAWRCTLDVGTGLVFLSSDAANRIGAVWRVVDRVAGDQHIRSSLTHEARSFFVDPAVDFDLDVL